MKRIKSELDEYLDAIDARSKPFREYLSERQSRIPYFEIVECVVDGNESDRAFLSNQLVQLHDKIYEDDHCIDNARACKIENGRQTLAYEKKRMSGCCGSQDELVTNTETGNMFFIGFNYGH